jgi:hypothetical protein
MTMERIKQVSLLLLGAMLTYGPAPAATRTEAILENSPVSCFYLVMHAYRQQLNVCKMPLNQASEQRFSRMSNALEDYIRKNARLDPEAIIANAKGAAERAAQSFPGQSLDISRRVLGSGDEGLRSTPFCESSAFMRLRQAMLDFTAEETEKALNAQLSTRLPVANGSCY